MSDAILENTEGSLHKSHSMVAPAGFWIRLVAAIVDGLIVSIGSYVFIIPLMLVAGFLSASENSGIQILGGTLGVISNLIGFVISFFYAGYFYSKKGSTPGKMVFKMQVIDSDTGANLSFAKAGIRDTVGKLVSSVILMIGYIMVAFRKDSKALHDLMVNSQVVKKS